MGGSVSSPLDGDDFRLRTTTSTMPSNDSLDADAFLDQGIFFAVSSFLMFEVHLARSGDAAAPRSVLKFIVVSALCWFTLPFLYVPFEPGEFNEQCHGNFDSTVMVISGIIAAFAVSYYVRASLIGALLLYAIGGTLQFLRLFDVVAEGFNSGSRLVLTTALSLSLRAGTRFISEISRGRNNEYNFHVLMNTLMQVLLIGFAPLINRQVFKHVLAWAIIFSGLFITTLVLLIIHCCSMKKGNNNEEQLPVQTSAAKPNSASENHPGSTAQAWKGIITQSHYWVARKAILHVIMIICTDAMLLISISKKAGDHEGWVKEFEEPITVVCQAAVMIAAGVMRCVYRALYRAFVFPRLAQTVTSPSDNYNSWLESCLKYSQAGMFILLIVMTLMIFFNIMYARIVVIVVVGILQAFAALPLTLERLNETINEVDDAVKENVAEVCKSALALARMAIVYVFTLYPFGLTGTFLLFFPLPYIAVFLINYFLVDAVNNCLLEKEVKGEEVHAAYINRSFLEGEEEDRSAPIPYTMCLTHSLAA